MNVVKGHKLIPSEILPPIREDKVLQILAKVFRARAMRSLLLLSVPDSLNEVYTKIMGRHPVDLIGLDSIFDFHIRANKVVRTVNPSTPEGFSTPSNDECIKSLEQQLSSFDDVRYLCYAGFLSTLSVMDIFVIMCGNGKTSRFQLTQGDAQIFGCTEQEMMLIRAGLSVKTFNPLIQRTLERIVETLYVEE